jgi:hypothetical protein
MPLRSGLGRARAERRARCGGAGRRGASPPGRVERRRVGGVRRPAAGPARSGPGWPVARTRAGLWRRGDERRGEIGFRPRKRGRVGAGWEATCGPTPRAVPVPQRPRRRGRNPDLSPVGVTRTLVLTARNGHGLIRNLTDRGQFTTYLYLYWWALWRWPSASGLTAPSGPRSGFVALAFGVRAHGGLRRACIRRPP